MADVLIEIVFRVTCLIISEAFEGSFNSLSELIILMKYLFVFTLSLIGIFITYSLFEPNSLILPSYSTISERPFKYVSYKFFTYRIYRYYFLGITYWIYLWIVLKYSTTYIINRLTQLLTFWITGLILSIPLTKEFSINYSRNRVLNSISICIYLEAIHYFIPVKEWPEIISSGISLIVEYIDSIF